jgi:hypothetical protein
MPKIIVTVNPDGTTKIDFEGYEGPSCLDADDKLRALLAAQGVQVEQTSFVAKPELQQGQEQQSHVQRQSGEA